MRMSYKAIKEGRSPCRNLSKANIQRLENAGFEWNVSKKVPFDERLKDLMAFKAEFGHCNVPCTRSKNNKHLSLGRWCDNLRQSYKNIKKGGTPKYYQLSKANMKRLENAGFEWNLVKNIPFDERLKDLMSFKGEFGHCNVPRTQSRNNKHLSLGNWCNDTRKAYKAIKEGRSTGRKLSKANIQRLENAGFEWNVSKKVPFDERLKDLMAFKAEFGHCNVPCTRSKNNKHLSLGYWCNNMRQSYKDIKDGRSPTTKLFKANIQRLEKAGFEFRCK
jgi:ferredoxin-thioredoxin reductase catalytic subunit